MTVGAILTLVALPLGLAEGALWGGWLAKRVLRLAAVLHYGRTGRRLIRAEEWSRHLQDIPAPLSQLGYALGHLVAALAAVVVRIASRAWRRKRLDRDALLRGLDASLVKDPNLASRGRALRVKASPLVFFPVVEDPCLEDGDLAWQDSALCAKTDPEAFFPEKGGSYSAAKRVCAQCEVKAECLQYALDHDERFGIWGGLTEEERRNLPGPAV